MLSDTDLRAELAAGRLVIDPPGLMQPASVDVTLGTSFRRLEARDLLDPYVENATDAFTRTTPFLLEPGEFLLATTAETIGVPDDLAVRVEGKSSLARLGLCVHVTAGFIDPGFRGEVTLELANLAGVPILLRPGQRIAQLCAYRLSSPAAAPYGSEGLGSHYQGQTGATGSRPLEAS